MFLYKCFTYIYKYNIYIKTSTLLKTKRDTHIKPTTVNILEYE